MEPQDRNVQAPPEPEPQRGGSPGDADFQLRQALESVELEDEVDRIASEVDEGMSQAPGSPDREWATDLLDWQSTAYAGWKSVDSFFVELDDRLDARDPDDLKNLAILTGKVLQKNLDREWIENRVEIVLALNILAVYGGPIAKLYLTNSPESNDE